MTEKEAIQMLERILDPDPWEDYGLSDKAKEALEMAVDALEKQIPKKPNMPLDAYWVCPICGRTVDYPFERCTRCGQAIDWTVGER